MSKDLNSNEIFIKEECIDFEDVDEIDLNVYDSDFDIDHNYNDKIGGSSENHLEAKIFSIVHVKLENETQEIDHPSLQNTEEILDFSGFDDVSKTQNISLLKLNQILRSKNRNGEIFKCNKCDYIGRTQYYLKRHYKIHFKEKKYKCAQCDYSDYFKSSLKVHERIHSKNKLYSCSRCSYVTKKKHSIKVHSKKMHPKTEMFNDNVFKNKEEEKDDVDKLDDQSESVFVDAHMTLGYKCNKCTFTVNDKSIFIRHKRLQCKEIRVNDTVQNIYSSSPGSSKSKPRDEKSNISVINRGDNGINKIYTCEGIKRKRTPTKWFDYVDPECLPLINENNDINNYFEVNGPCMDNKIRLNSERIEGHSTLRPLTKTYKCSQCHYSSQRPSNIKIHEAKHSDVKPYKCSNCFYSSKYQSNLKAHLKRNVKCRQGIVRSNIPETVNNKCTVNSTAITYNHSALQRVNSSGSLKEELDVGQYSALDMAEGRKRKSESGHRIALDVKEDSQLNEFLGFDQEERLRIKARYKVPSDFSDNSTIPQVESSEVKLFKCDDCYFSSKYKGNLRKHKTYNCKRILIKRDTNYETTKLKNDKLILSQNVDETKLKVSLVFSRTNGLIGESKRNNQSANVKRNRRERHNVNKSKRGQFQTITRLNQVNDPDLTEYAINQVRNPEQEESVDQRNDTSLTEDATNKLLSLSGISKSKNKNTRQSRHSCEGSTVTEDVGKIQSSDSEGENNSNVGIGDSKREISETLSPDCTGYAYDPSKESSDEPTSDIKNRRKRKCDEFYSRKNKNLRNSEAATEFVQKCSNLISSNSITQSAPFALNEALNKISFPYFKIGDNFNENQETLHSELDTNTLNADVTTEQFVSNTDSQLNLTSATLDAEDEEKELPNENHFEAEKRDATLFNCNLCDFFSSKLKVGKIHLLYHEMASLYFSFKTDYADEVNGDEIDKLVSDNLSLFASLSEDQPPPNCSTEEASTIFKLVNNLNISDRAISPNSAAKSEDITKYKCPLRKENNEVSIKSEPCFKYNIDDDYMIQKSDDSMIQNVSTDGNERCSINPRDLTLENQRWENCTTDCEVNRNYAKIKCTNSFLRKRIYRKSFFRCH